MKIAKLILCLACFTPNLLLAQEAKVTEVLSRDLSNIPGKEGLMITVEYPPGASDPYIATMHMDSFTCWKARLLCKSRAERKSL
jgi:hypothetical protein